MFCITCLDNCEACLLTLKEAADLVKDALDEVEEVHLKLKYITSLTSMEGTKADVHMHTHRTLWVIISNCELCF